MNLFENLYNYKKAIKKEATGIYSNDDFKKAGYIYNKREMCWYYPKIYKKGTDEYQLMYDDNSGTFIVFNKTKFDDPKTHDSYGSGDNLATWDYKNTSITQAIQKFKELFNVKENIESLNENKLIDTIQGFVDKIKNYLQSKKEDKTINNILSKIESNGNDLEAFFDELVPASGPAETQAGEIIRAMNRIGYRWYNDGDYFFDGYGLETCGPCAEYLASIDNKFSDKITSIIENSHLESEKRYESEYESQITSLGEIVIQYILDNPTLLITPNDKDCLDFTTTHIEEMAPKFECDIDVYDEVRAHVESGNIDWDDVEWTIRDWDIIRGHDLNGSNGSYYVNDLSYEEYNDLINNINSYMISYADELDNEYGDDWDED